MKLRTKAKARLGRFLRDEQGDEGVNKMLILALIAIPLIIILIIFGGEIKGWFEEAANDLKNNKGKI